MKGRETVASFSIRVLHSNNLSLKETSHCDERHSKCRKEAKSCAANSTSSPWICIVRQSETTHFYLDDIGKRWNRLLALCSSMSSSSASQNPAADQTSAPATFNWDSRKK